MVKANSDLYDPSNPLARVIASSENDSDERFGAPDVKTMTTRIDRGDACRVDAIATVAGVSRATLLGQLILIGLDQVTTNLSSASVRKYSQQLAKEFEKEFPGAWQKLRLLVKMMNLSLNVRFKFMKRLKTSNWLINSLPTENDMLVLEGILINVFETPKGVTKDGKEYGGESKIQVMYENTLANGEKRTEMETLTVSDTSPYLGKKNAPVRVPVALNVYQGKAYLKATI